MTGRLLRMSTLFVRTLRDDPNDAEVPSHRLLVRAGYIRRAAPGIYTWLPLGLRVLRKIEEIIREEMDDMGAQELSFPALLPKEPYEATHRWTDYGHNIFRLQDRKGGDYLLGPTHEEMFTLVVKDLYSSYKDLPLSIYQIQTKYRDEARPRAGLLRGREFVMKDSYSFDIDDAGLAGVLPAAPRRLHPDLRPARLRLRHRQGDLRRDGRLGERGVPRQGRGRRGHLRPLHPLRLRRQRRGGRPCAPPAAVSVRRRARRARRGHPRHPDHRHAGRPPQRGLPPRRPPLGGRRHAQERAWSCSSTPTAPASPSPSACPATATSTRSASRASSSRSRSRPWTRPSSPKHPALVKGYIGPEALGEESKSGIRFLVDPRVVEGTRWVTGANVPGSHVIDLVVGRDFTPDGTIEAADVRDGDACPNCDEGTLESARGVEMGHIFQLGRKYAEALGLKVLDENGKLVTVTMGSYGIGPSRAVAAIAEGTLDDIGLCWPRNVAPADVHVVAAGKDEAIFAAAETLAARPQAGRARGAPRRPRRQGQPGREVQGRRAHRRADDRHGRPRPGRRHRRGPRPRPVSARSRGRAAAAHIAASCSQRRRLTAAASATSRRRRLAPPRASRSPSMARCRTAAIGAWHRFGMRDIEAVIFDWGGTLTRWHDVDFHAESLALAEAVRRTPTPDDDHHAHAERLHRAGDVVWGRSRDHQQSATIADLFTEAGLDHDPDAAGGLLRLLGAAHAHRPRGAADVRGAAVGGDQGRRAVQHHLAAGVARRLLRARRGLRPRRR